MLIMRSLSRSSHMKLKKKGVCGSQVPDPTPSNWCRWQQAGQGPRDSTARPATLQVPDKNPVSSEIRRGRSVKQNVHATQPCQKFWLGTWFCMVKHEAFASTKGFWRSRIQSAQAMRQRLPFSRHVGTYHRHWEPLQALEWVMTSL